MESIVGKFAKDISAFTFRGMELGDTFETKGILSGVEGETLKWKLVETNFAKTDLIFDVTYYGINVGQFSIHPAENCRVSAL